MPKYSYKCKKCKAIWQQMNSVSANTSPCPCGGIAARQMPKLSGVRNTETVDKITNKKHIANQKEIVKERKLDYYWEVEVPNMVNSGTYSIETMLEQGWVYHNEKGELVTRTKPIQKS